MKGKINNNCLLVGKLIYLYVVLIIYEDRRCFNKDDRRECRIDGV